MSKKTAARAGFKAITVGALEVNCYILWDVDTREAFVIDPGGDGPKVLKAVERENLNVRYIVNTHGHFDHVGGDGEVKAALGAPIAIHGEDAELMSEAHEHGVFFGVHAEPQPEPDILLNDNSELKAGSLTLRVIHTPGHTHGGVCLYEESEALLFTGDTLFAGSIGRTDLGGGSFEVIMSSIKKRLMTLGDEVVVLPGHGPESTIGAERRTNQYILNG